MQATPGQPLPPSVLCQRSDPADIPFDSTAELEELTDVDTVHDLDRVLVALPGIDAFAHRVLARPEAFRHSLADDHCAGSRNIA